MRRTPCPRRALYGGVSNRRITIRDLQLAKDRGERWPMLTAYDYSTAQVFDEAGIPVLLVGDSAANVVYGYDTTVPVTVDELLPLVRGVVRGTSRALVVADLPFGSLPGGAAAGARDRGPVHEGGRRAGGQARGRPARRRAGRGARRRPASRSWRTSGSPRSRSTRSAATGCRAAATRPRTGCSRTPRRCSTRARSPSCSRSCRPSSPREVTKQLHIPTIGIGAGPDCDAQVLVWQDMAGLSQRQPGEVRQAVRRRRRRAARRRHPLRRRGARRHLSRPSEHSYS